MSELDVKLAGDTELRMTRNFAAAPELVYAAHTQPALLMRWYGALVSAEVDLRVGGAWRLVSRRPDGREIGQFGIYREIEPNARLVQTENWSDWNPGELMVSTIFAPTGAATRLEVTMRFPSREVRDVLVKGGMNEEAAGQYRRLEDVLVDYQMR
ncbi:MAG: ATPase [Hyphomicrobiales bacterium]|nr:MAG: ATPase [Hyphomicrobiales bacterium]